MKCLECKWDDSNAPREGKCCGECGLCPLCEQYTLYKKTRPITSTMDCGA